MKEQTAKRPIATKLIRTVFSAYFVLASLVTVTHLVFQYLDAEDRAVAELKYIHETFREPLAMSAWNLDDRQLLSTLAGILSLRGVSGVSFRHPDNRGVVSLGKPSSELHESFPIIYRTESGASHVSVGDLTLYPDGAEIWRSIERSLYSIALAAVVKTLALYALFRMVARRLLSQPLARFVQVVNQIRVGSDIGNEPIRPARHLDDEFGLLGEAFVNMTLRLNGSMKENERLNEDLSRLNKELEERIKTRTKELDEAQQKLLKAAHAAGRDQVTSEILHNVGNVVNSMTVSIGEVRKGVMAEPLDALSAVTTIFKQCAANNDYSKIGQIADYLDEFMRRSWEGRKETSGELDILERFVTHIRHVLESQEQPRNESQYRQVVSMGRLLNDAINIAGLKNDSNAPIRLTFDQEAADGVGPVVTDEHRLLQVLTNLLVNAKRATQDAPNGYRDIRIEVSSAPSRNEWVDIIIQDNGVGIAAENMERIFQPGFTTKSSGRGLGLHNSANNVRAIGGEIECHSDGEMRGACFRIRLPRRRATKVV